MTTSTKHSDAVLLIRMAYARASSALEAADSLINSLNISDVAGVSGPLRAATDRLAAIINRFETTEPTHHDN